MPISDTYGALGQNTTFAKNADQVEASAIVRQASSVVSSLLDERISGEIDDLNLSNDRLLDEQAREEEIAGATLEIIEHRIKLLGGSYPFRLDGQVLVYTGAGDGVYEFCLRTALMDHSANQNAIDIVLFELLAAKVVGDMFAGDHYRCGWPTHDPIDLPNPLADMASILHERCGEWWWQPQPGNSANPTTKEVKDGGIDFLVWRRLDSRNGSFFIAGQCACGNDWRNKYHDLNLDKITRWWPRPTVVGLTRAFAIPYAIPGDIAIQEVSREAGLVFDRIRLTLAGRHAGANHQWDQWLSTTREAVERQLTPKIRKAAKKQTAKVAAAVTATPSASTTKRAATRRPRKAPVN